MELIRDLLRDLVGIIFPGGLLVILTLWLFFCIAIAVVPINALNVFAVADNSTGFFVLLIFSYIAGQLLRVRGLGRLEKICTEEYQKRRKPTLSQKDFDQSIETIVSEEGAYFSGQSTLDKLQEIYRQHIEKFGIWEEFPYPYFIKGRRLLYQSADYNEVFDKYDSQGFTKFSRFFNFCKTVIYEYSPSLKEELIRQEALIRLLAGIYYVNKYGTVVSLVVGVIHMAMIVSFFQYRLTFLSYANPVYLSGIVTITIFAYIVFIYLNRTILSELRFMRMKEIDLAYDGFYIISKKYKFDVKVQLESGG